MYFKINKFLSSNLIFKAYIKFLEIQTSNGRKIKERGWGGTLGVQAGPTPALGAVLASPRRSTQSVSHTQLTSPPSHFFESFSKKKKRDITAQWMILLKLFPSSVTTGHEHIRTAITYYWLSKMLKWTGWKKYSFHTLKNYSKLF